MVPVKLRVPVPVIFAVDVRSFVIEILPSFIIAALFVKSPVLIVPAFESVPLFIKDVVWIFPPFIIAVLFVKSPAVMLPEFASVPLLIKESVLISPPAPIVSSEPVAFKFTDFKLIAEISLVRFGYGEAPPGIIAFMFFAGIPLVQFKILFQSLSPAEPVQLVFSDCCV